MLKITIYLCVITQQEKWVSAQIRLENDWAYKCANDSGIGFGNFTGSTITWFIFFGPDSHMTNLDEPYIWSNDPDSIDNLSFLRKAGIFGIIKMMLIILVVRVKE